MSADDARCPKCGRFTCVKHNASSRAWWCLHCKMAFEPDDDGDISYGQPSRRLEREERQKLRKKLTAQERQRRVSEGLRLSWARRKREYPSADAGD